MSVRPEFPYAARRSRGVARGFGGWGRSSHWIAGRMRPGAVARYYFCQSEKESEHGNEAQKGGEEIGEEEGRQEEEKGCQTQGSNEEETGAEEEKGGPEGRQEKKGCEETRQEESQATDEDDQACGETSGACPAGGPCCTVDGGDPWGKDCPESRCCLAVSDRVSALGGGRIFCGRALRTQSPIRRPSTLEVPVPPAHHGGRAYFISRPVARPGRASPKIFLLCVATPTSAQVPDPASLFRRLTDANSFIRLRFRAIPQRAIRNATRDQESVSHPRWVG